MAWERRGNYLYYYQAARVNGKRRRCYKGRGPAAEREAAAVVARRAAWEEGTRLAQEEQQVTEAAERAVTSLDASAGLMMKALLLASGYFRKSKHWHRSERSRRYVGATKDQSSGR